LTGKVAWRLAEIAVGQVGLGPALAEARQIAKTSAISALSALTPCAMADKYRALTAGGELRQSERPAPKLR